MIDRFCRAVQTMRSHLSEAYRMQINIGDRIIVAGQVLLVDEIDREIWLVTAFDRFGYQHEVYLSDITCIETTACLLTRSELPRYAASVL
jgi:hypothetical protein